MSAPIMTAYNGHAEDCLCVPCMTADMNAHLVSVGLDPTKYDDGRNGENAKGQRTRYAKPGQRCGRGFVRELSDRQLKYIRNLMAERDTTNLTRLPGSEDIEHMSLAGARDLIDRLLACPFRASRPVRPATVPMLGFLAKLLAQRDTSGVGNCPSEAPAELSFAECSRLIDALKVAPFRPRPAAPTATVKPAALTLGMYRHDDGRIVRTQRAKAGHLYGKVLDRDAGDAWVYTAGALTGLTEDHRMSIADVNALSIALGCCCCCGRTLTATVDGVGPAARVIGPICAAKYGYA